MVRAIIFDFDGVIVLSDHARFAALQKISERHGGHIDPNLFHSMIGITTNDFLTRHVPSIDAETREKILDDFDKEYRDKVVDHVTPIKDTVDFIANYDGKLHLAVASGSTVKVLEAMLKHLGIRSKFSAVFGKEHVTAHKPDPMVYIEVIKDLELTPAECIVIEDSLTGVIAAVGAGAPVYVLLNGVNSREIFNDLPVAGFLESAKDIQGILSK